VPWLATDVSHGDLAVDAAGVDPRRRAVLDLPWTWLRQVHGSRVVVVTRPGEHAGVEADAAVTAVPGAALAVQTADCAPVALLASGAVGVVHAGWRGLAGGIVARSVAAVRDLGGTDVCAVIGPCIRARCYEFGVADLDRVAASVGDVVRGTTAWGTPALDLVAGVRAALAAAGVDDVADAGVCTACSPVHRSHRARGEAERQSMVAWR
jgi:polyphenol oxidase